MNIAAFFTALNAIIKAVPIVEKWFQRLVDLWVDKQIAEYKNVYTTKKMKRLALMKGIMNATSDKERVALSIVLADVNRL